MEKGLGPLLVCLTLLLQTPADMRLHQPAPPNCSQLLRRSQPFFTGGRGGGGNLHPGAGCGFSNLHSHIRIGVDVVRVVGVVVQHGRPTHRDCCVQNGIGADSK